MKKWVNEFPKKEGLYWFYGNPTMGSMGAHFRDDYKIEPEMYLISVFKISNGFLASTNGYFVSEHKFNKDIHKEGWCGYWAKAELPEKPEDKACLF